MSLVSLANAHVRKFRARAASIEDASTPAPQEDEPHDAAAKRQAREAALATPPKNAAVSTALETLAKYIPAEIVTLYITAVSFRTQLHDFGISSKAIFFFFMLLTPALLLLAFLGDAKKTVGQLPPPKIWPYWKMIASTIAYGAWACAIPGNPWVASTHAGVSSVLALLASVILGLVGRVVEPAHAEA